MEIDIQRDDRDQSVTTMEIIAIQSDEEDENVNIETIWLQEYGDDFTLKQWARKINKIHNRKSKKMKNKKKKNTNKIHNRKNKKMKNKKKKSKKSHRHRNHGIIERKTKSSMEIAIQRDNEDPSFYTLTINKNINIETIWAQAYISKIYGYNGDDKLVKQWVNEIKKIHSKNKKKKKNNKKKSRQPLIIGLSPDRSTNNYANGTTKWLYSSDNVIHKKPYDILQLCVGRHCLIYQQHVKRYKHDDNSRVYKPLKDLLSDHNTIVVGVKMNEVAKKLENECGLVISRPVDLQVLAGEVKGCGEGYYRKFGLEKLAMEVLGEEWDMKKPDSMRWWEGNGDFFI